MSDSAIGRDRVATEKQVAYIRTFGVEPPPGMTVAEASQLLDQLTEDPAALARQSKLNAQRRVEEDENRRRTPAPRGIAAKAQKFIDQCNEGLPWLPELERRLEDILARGSFADDDEREELRSDFQLRIDDIKEALEGAIDDIGCGLENWRIETDAAEKRVEAHDLADNIKSYGRDVAEARADLASLIAWSEDLLKRI